MSVLFFSMLVVRYISENDQGGNLTINSKTERRKGALKMKDSAGTRWVKIFIKKVSLADLIRSLEMVNIISITTSKRDTS